MSDWKPEGVARLRLSYCSTSCCRVVCQDQTVSRIRQRMVLPIAGAALVMAIVWTTFPALAAPAPESVAPGPSVVTPIYVFGIPVDFILFG